MVERDMRGSHNSYTFAVRRDCFVDVPPPETSGARPSWAGSARSRMRCRRWAATCPTNGTHDWTQQPEHSFCRPAQGFDPSAAIDAVRRHDENGTFGGDRASHHLTRDLGFRRKANMARYMRCLRASGFVRPFLWRVERPVDEGMAMPRKIGGAHPDLASPSSRCRATLHEALPCFKKPV